MRQYIALIHKDDGSDYGVSFPDLPGGVTAGRDLDDARRWPRRRWPCTWRAWRKTRSRFRSPPRWRQSWLTAKTATRSPSWVKAPPAIAKAVRVNMTIPEDELERIDKFAAEHGYTRSGVLLHAAKQAILHGGGQKGEHGGPPKETQTVAETAPRKG